MTEPIGRDVLIGKILGIKRGLGRQYQHEVLVKVEGVEDRNEASRLIGAKVELKAKKTLFRGKIVSIHGGGGVLIARFRKPLFRNVGGMEVNIVLKSRRQA